MPAPFRPRASLLQRLFDHLLFPLNMWLSEEASHRLGLTPIDHDRVRAALPFCRGKLLDVGCGNNLLVRTYGNGVGVDIQPYPEIALRCDSSLLPFKDATFDTVAMLASLNHIVRRNETLDECRRILTKEGRVLITMIPESIGLFCHRIRRSLDPDQLARGIQQDEAWGLSSGEIRKLLESSGFRLSLHMRFMWGLNNLYVGEKF